MALSANVRQSKRISSEVTVGEVAEVMAKEDSGFIEKLFSRRGSNPISMEKVREFTEQK